MKSKKANLKKEVKGPMKMKKGGYLEPEKELMFGGPKKYQSGSRPGMGPTAGRQASYGSRNPQVEAENRELYSYLTTLEKMSNMSPSEKTKLAQQRQAAANKGKQKSPAPTAPKNNPPKAASAMDEQQGKMEAKMVASMAARDIQSPKASAAPAPKSQTGSADYPRGGIGTSSNAYYNAEAKAAIARTKTANNPTQSAAAPAPKASAAPAPKATPAPKAAAGSGSAAPKQQSKGSSAFNQAFAAARKEGKTTFTFEGKSYGTRRADETPEQHKAAMTRVAGSATPAPAAKPSEAKASEQAPQRATTLLRNTTPSLIPASKSRPSISTSRQTSPGKVTPREFANPNLKTSKVESSGMEGANKARKSDMKKSKLMRGGYLEPDKELMFGGKSKYQKGGAATTSGRPNVGRPTQEPKSVYTQSMNRRREEMARRDDMFKSDALYARAGFTPEDREDWIWSAYYKPKASSAPKQAGGMVNTPMKPKKKMEMPASMQTPPKKKKPMGLMDKLENAMGKSKYKSGGFPDLNKDGKITKADILKGRGVIKEAGGMMEECGPGRPCHNAKKAAKTARKQKRNLRNPNAARRRSIRAANAGNGGGGAGIGGAMKTIAGLGALGFMAKKAKDSM